MSKINLRAIDFFCSIGGMTYGFRKSGVDVIAGIDIDPSCKETYEFNNPDSKFITADIEQYSNSQLIKDTQIKRSDDNLIFIGCSPCQYWSIMNTDKTKSSATKNLLSEFQKYVEYFKPGYVVVENVPGIMRKADKSKLDYFIKSLRDNHYTLAYGILNANNYGVPQNRRRFVLIASRISKNICLPLGKEDSAPVVKDFIGVANGFKKIAAGYNDESNFLHKTANLSELNLKRIRQTRHDGGSRLNWKDMKALQLKCYVGKDDSFNDIYGRMSWDKPAPTITTKFHSISNGRFGHPEEDRALSLREGATLQTFPKDYVFKDKNIGKVAKHIGNAVPPNLAYHIAKQILRCNGK
ncbi:DNA cytosine methyltransferase [Clostridium sp.]|uniref:DNA cytosine methyltransferase n=1 Tax=Clostridium sp. TaxID=1506 RepID=UPI002851E651|nr:DNA cytosine methyltransferase [Clostridium sp.]MDR3596527.1 DNA cytosine methyltransferase [Clostridium sp.]